MVLRKPYALLIKYFRLIHVILTGLMIYIIIRSNLLIRFFNNFIESGYVTNQINFAGSYINFFMYFNVFLILITCITIFFLMKTKKKPTRLYIFTILYYVFLFIMFSVMHSALVRFEIELIEATTARLYRDLSIIIIIPQLLFTILIAIRAVGFDLKKFNFNKDLQELKIEAQDNEEFEIAVDREDYKLKRSLRRTLRELRYYLLENKFILFCIGIVIATILVTSIYLNVAVYNRSYVIDQTFVSNNMRIKVTDSYLTNLSYNGTKLSKDKYYVVVDVSLENLMTNRNTLKLENYRLLINNKIIVPTVNRNEYFLDLGTPYNKEKLAAKSENKRLLIYEVDEDLINEDIVFRVVNSITASAGDIFARYSDVTLKPKILNEVETKQTVGLNEEIKFVSPITTNSSANIKKYNITRYFKYNYNFCVNRSCRNSIAIVSPDVSEYNQTILVLDGEINFNKESIINKRISNKQLYPMFIKVLYTINGTTNTTSIKDITPNDLNNQILLQTNNIIEKADKLSLVFAFRNEEYIINLK